MENKESNLSEILVSTLYLILGIVLISATEELLRTFNYILVSICAIIGVLQIISFILGKKYKNNDYNDLLVAVIFIWVSLILYVYYGFIINILPILFSLYLFVISINMIAKYINNKNKKDLILPIIAIIIGLLLIFNPGSIILTYLKITGVYLLIIPLLNFLNYLNKLKETKIKNLTIKK